MSVVCLMEWLLVLWGCGTQSGSGMTCCLGMGRVLGRNDRSDDSSHSKHLLCLLAVGVTLGSWGLPGVD